MKTLDEIIEQLGDRTDIHDIIILLGIEVTDLLERFDDKVSEHYDEAIELLEELE